MISDILYIYFWEPSFIWENNLCYHCYLNFDYFAKWIVIHQDRSDSNFIDSQWIKFLINYWFLNAEVIQLKNINIVEKDCSKMLINYLSRVLLCFYWHILDYVYLFVKTYHLAWQYYWNLKARMSFLKVHHCILRMGLIIFKTYLDFIH
jgi:hypothetical protein